MSPARVTLLGPFAARNGNGDAITLPKKARALLAFLIVEKGRRFERGELAALLWSNTASDQARHSLRQCLTVLRRALPELADALTSEGERLRLGDAKTISSDLDDWRRLERGETSDELVSADALHLGEFLSGLSLPHEPFDDWVTNERRSYLAARQALLAKLARLQARGGDLPTAVETARRLTALDPYREESSRLLMELLASSGQRGLALVEHARVERMLREELQLSPDAVTRQLVERIRRGAPGSAPSSHLGGEISKSEARLASPQQGVLASRPSLTLLPFANLTGDPTANDLAQAVTEDVACALIRERWPINIAALSAQQISPVIGANATAARTQYTASGSIRRYGNKVRLVVQLTSTAQALQVWSGRFDAEGHPSLGLNDPLCQQIVSKLATAVRMAEQYRAGQSPQRIELLSPYELYLRAQAVCRRGSAGNATALQLLRRATELDPTLGVAHALSARCLHLQRLMGWAHPDEPALYDAVRRADRALNVDPENPEVLWMSGLALSSVDGNISDGRHLVDRSLSINPSDASAWIASCFVRAHSGEVDAAIAHFQRAQEVNPDDSSQHVQWHAAATAYFIAGRHEEADAATDKALAEQPGYPGSLRLKIATSALLGKSDNAEKAARKLFAVNPDSSIANIRSYWRLWSAYTEHATEAMMEGWRRAGMPDG